MDDDAPLDPLQEVLSLFRILKQGNVLTENRDAVRAIGERINDAGGLGLMVDIYEAVRTLWQTNGEKGEDKPHPDEIEAAWDGIGEWRW